MYQVHINIDMYFEEQCLRGIIDMYFALNNVIKGHIDMYFEEQCIKAY